MAVADSPRIVTSAKPLTLAAYVSFFPIGVVTVLLGPMLPTLSAQWSLNYSQAGALFTAQYLTSTAAVALSGLMVARWGFRFAMKAGLLLASVAVALLLAGPMWLGVVSIGAYGAGLGFAVPAANLLVAEVNPGRRSAVLNVLNFCWSAGAVACPFLVAVAVKNRMAPVFLFLLAGFMLLVTIGIAVMPASIVEPARATGAKKEKVPIDWKHASLPVLGALFFIYVGTENSFGGWVASYSKSLGNMTPTLSLMTPSFFYAALTFGRLLAPALLRMFDETFLVRAGLLVACSGTAGLMLSHALTAVLASACVAGFGLAGVYPIMIALLSREFGPTAARVGSIMFTLSNLGGGLLPWIVGVASNRFGTLKAGLAVPLIGTALMFVLYLRKWQPEAAEHVA
ncbi:MAG TPA: MFS transporter [Candidatus Solibacter sp.]|nr:MFS transporter [Candidatus Solibacter sp.]